MLCLCFVQEYIGSINGKSIVNIFHSSLQTKESDLWYLPVAAGCTFHPSSVPPLLSAPGKACGSHSCATPATITHCSALVAAASTATTIISAPSPGAVVASQQQLWPLPISTVPSAAVTVVFIVFAVLQPSCSHCG